MRTNNDHGDDDVAKPQTSRPRTLSSDNGDRDQASSKRARLNPEQGLRQTQLPFKPIAKAKSEGNRETASSSKGLSKDISMDDIGTMSKFFPGRGQRLGEPSKGASGPKHSSKEDSSPARGTSSKSWDNKKTGGSGRNFKSKGGDGDSFAARKDRLKNIAATTLEAIDDGSYECEGTKYDLASTVKWMNDHTVYYPPKGVLEKWKDSSGSTLDVDPSRPALRRGAKSTQISLMQLTTLEGSRWMHTIVASANPGQKDLPRIGVLNFASAKKPGGGFINGARAQEESIARSSTLYASLMIPEGQKFYTLHHADARGGFYTHAMIYSPRVQLIKNDAGDWLEPIEVDMITSPAVNAGDVRNKYNRKHSKRDDDEGDSEKPWKQDKSGKWSKNKKAGKSRKEDSDDDSPSTLPEAKSKEELEEMIDAEMYERMARILYLCQIQSIPNLVLGSFGTGVFRNDVETVADMWMRLLDAEDAPFKGVFERVVFAILDTETVDKFANVLGDSGIEVTAPRETGERKGKGRTLVEASTDVSMQDVDSDMSQEWKII